MENFATSVRNAGEAARRQLLSSRLPSGWWEGELSSSALSTAVAVLALGSVPGKADHRELMQAGLRWLAESQNPDGGWGDTTISRSNAATTLLVWAAFGLAERIFGSSPAPQSVARAENWIRSEAGGLDPKALKSVLARRYGKDKTFAVPILMACATGGRLGAAPACWKEVPALPFELAAFPRKWFAALRLPVVSYALPALIAIGQVRAFQAPGRGPWAWLRKATMAKTRRLLEEIQPAGGGFLEATPLTGFVTMAMAQAGAGNGPVVTAAVEFLQKSARTDGSWPIDTNLATWATTLSIKALGGELPQENREAVLDWLLDQQYKVQHPYCLSAPGGWAWTDLPGGVPDADDTAGALLALRCLTPQDGRDPDKKARIVAAASAGARWLEGLQNADGGIPTFCKGWGSLPFDRSAPDLTAHALAAWQAWRSQLPWDPRKTMQRAIAWLAKTQREDGSWTPLWFGNENHPDEENPVYGTATVLKYLCQLDPHEFSQWPPICEKAAHFLAAAQLPDGGWGGGPHSGPPSIEETSAVIEALTAWHELTGNLPGIPKPDPAKLLSGIESLIRMTRDGTQFPAAPIGLYFAKLWYYEKLYPQIATVAALQAARRWIRDPAPASGQPHDQT